jgi:hypothetical protein
LTSKLHDDESLDFLLAGVRDENQRKLVRSAYFAFASGDPNTFAVQFAVLLKAHALALKTAPTKLQRALTEEVHKLSDLLVAHRAYLESVSGPRPAADVSSEREGEVADAISRIEKAIHERLREERELLLEIRSDLAGYPERATVSLLNRLAAHRIILALLLSYAAGLVTLPIFQYVFHLFNLWKH